MAVAALEPSLLEGVSPKWWEQLLSQDRLRDALDKARDYLDEAAQPQALLVARRLADQASNGARLDPVPPDELVSVIASHLDRLHRLGRDTVAIELDRHRRTLADDLPFPGVLERARRAAAMIVGRVIAKLEQWLVNHPTTPAAPRLQVVAERAVVGALHEVALEFTSAQINDGRVDAARELDAVGAYRTAVLDRNTCVHCGGEDDGVLLSMPVVLANPLPDPDCAGGDRCRCTYVFVSGRDPAAVAAGLV
jgi:hypothetical protein